VRGGSFVRVAVGFTALAGVGTLAASAPAHTERIGTKVTIEWNGAGFEGAVKSDSGACVKDRKVSLFRRGEPGALATVKSDGDGGFSVTGLPRTNGDYYAKVARRVLKKNGEHEHLCKGAKSKRSNDALVRDCDEVTLFNGSGGSEPTTISVDDDLDVFVGGTLVYEDANDVADDLPPIPLGPVNFGTGIRIVASNSSLFGTGPVSLDPIWAQCEVGLGSGSAALDPTGVPPGNNAEPGAVFYDKTFPLPEIAPTR
jgi:hypothetical protein